MGRPDRELKNLTGKPARKQIQKGCNGTEKFHEKGKRE